VQVTGTMYGTKPEIESLEGRWKTRLARNLPLKKPLVGDASVLEGEFYSRTVSFEDFLGKNRLTGVSTLVTSALLSAGLS
jgi:hypothetical protein